MRRTALPGPGSRNFQPDTYGQDGRAPGRDATPIPYPKTLSCAGREEWRLNSNRIGRQRPLSVLEPADLDVGPTRHLQRYAHADQQDIRTGFIDISDYLISFSCVKKSRREPLQRVAPVRCAWRRRPTLPPALVRRQADRLTTHVSTPLRKAVGKGR